MCYHIEIDDLRKEHESSYLSTTKNSNILSGAPSNHQFTYADIKTSDVMITSSYLKSNKQNKIDDCFILYRNWLDLENFRNENGIDYYLYTTSSYNWNNCQGFKVTLDRYGMINLHYFLKYIFHSWPTRHLFEFVSCLLSNLLV